MLALRNTVRSCVFNASARAFSSGLDNQETKSTRVVHPDRLKYADLTFEQMNLEKKDDKYHVRGLASLFYGREERKSPTRPQYVWVTEHPVSDRDIEQIFFRLTQKNQSVHINTGTHGDKQGKTVKDTQNALYAETGFLKEDVFRVWDAENASFHIVSKDSGPTRPKNANHIIDAWCYSAHKTTREVKEAAEARIEKIQNQGGNQAIGNHNNDGQQVIGNHNSVFSGTQNNNQGRVEASGDNSKAVGRDQIDNRGSVQVNGNGNKVAGRDQINASGGSSVNTGTSVKVGALGGIVIALAGMAYCQSSPEHWLCSGIRSEIKKLFT